MKQIKLKSGEPFQIKFFIKEDKIPVSVNPGEYIVIGLYDQYCGKYVIDSSKSEIKYDPDSMMYYATIPGEITNKLSGNVDMEIAVYDRHNKDVSYTNKIVSLYFEERKLNEYIYE